MGVKDEIQPPNPHIHLPATPPTSCRPPPQGNGGGLLCSGTPLPRTPYPPPPHTHTHTCLSSTRTTPTHSPHTDKKTRVDTHTDVKLQTNNHAHGHGHRRPPLLGSRSSEGTSTPIRTRLLPSCWPGPLPPNPSHIYQHTTLHTPPWPSFSHTQPPDRGSCALDRDGTHCNSRGSKGAEHTTAPPPCPPLQVGDLRLLVQEGLLRLVCTTAPSMSTGVA